jgi:hypothetical protein
MQCVCVCELSDCVYLPDARAGDDGDSDDHLPGEDAKSHVSSRDSRGSSGHVPSEFWRELGHESEDDLLFRSPRSHGEPEKSPSRESSDSERSSLDSDMSVLNVSDVSIGGYEVSSAEGLGSADEEDSVDSMEAFLFPREPDAGEEDGADPVPRGAADYVAAVPGGVLRLYSKSQTMVATCLLHGAKCRMTRKYSAAKVKNRPGQGRPIGLLCAWLTQGLHADVDTLRKHVDIALPPLEERVVARARVQEIPAMVEFFRKERRRDGAEPDEPEFVP